MVAVLFQSEREQFVDANGKPIVGGKLYVGEPNQDPRTNPIVVYAEREKINPLTQPILLDADGRTEDSVWIGETYSYVVDDPDDVQILTEPYIKVWDIEAIVEAAIAAAIALIGTGLRNIFANGGMCVTLGSPVSLTSSFQQGKVSEAYGRTTNVTAGTLTWEADEDYASGQVCLYSGVSAPGSGDYTEHQQRLMSADALRLAQKEATFSIYVEHNKGVPVDYTMTVGICNSLNNFSAYTAISTSSAVSVQTGTRTRLTYTIGDMGDTTNGVVLVMKAAHGAITTKSFKFGDAQVEEGVEATKFAMLPYEVSKAAIIANSGIIPDGFTATTQATGDSTQKLATDEFVQQERKYIGEEQDTYDVYQRVSSVIPIDTTVPLISEGTEILSVTRACLRDTNKVLLTVDVNGIPSVTGATAALFAGNTCIRAQIFAHSSVYGASSFTEEYAPGTTDPVVYSVRVGVDPAGFVDLNGDFSGNRAFGGACKCALLVEEIQYQS